MATLALAEAENADAAHQALEASGTSPENARPVAEAKTVAEWARVVQLARSDPGTR